MKYLVLLCDGLADEPMAELGNKTVVQATETPNMDKLAKGGMCGLIHSVPEGMPAGSDVCNLSIFGYDPKKYYSGRSPLEAASIGIQLGENDLAFRCNSVTLSESYSLMESFSAHHINESDANIVIKRLQDLFKDDGVEFYKSVGYRNIVVLRDVDYRLKTTPPHDVTDKYVVDYLPSGKGVGSDRILDIMLKSRLAFKDISPTCKANSIWLWGEGKKPQLPSYKELFNISGAVISAVDLLKGIGVCAGLDVINVPGATGYLDTNFKGKAEYAIEALKTHDYVFVHIEAPDEAGHLGSIKDKMQAIKSIDEIMLPIIMKGLESFGDFRILLTPDHYTPIHLKTHSRAAVPAIIYGKGVTPDENVAYSEFIKPSFEFKDGYKIGSYFINGK